MLLSDVYTDPIRRKKMVDKRVRKMSTVLDHLPAPVLEGPADAETTLLGWGSTWGVIKEAAERLNAEGTSVNHLHVKTLIPLHIDETRGHSEPRSANHHYREQSEWPVRPSPTSRERHRRAWAHS